MDDLRDLREKLKYMNLAKVARTCGLNREVISRFTRGETNNISANTYIILKKFFDEKEGKNANVIN